ncbi:hypothetical protein ACWGJ2_08835 [Streptomyces sp. NPDC054796]
MTHSSARLPRTVRPGRTVLVAVLAAALGAGAAGCSSPPTRDYAVPDRVCGTDVDPDTLAPLLPTGTEVRARPGAVSASGASCGIDVVREDGEKFSPSLRVRRDAVPDGADPLEVKKGTLERYGHPREADIGDGARIADRGALAVKSCPGKGEDTTFALQVDLLTDTPEKVPERRKALERFVRGYLSAAYEKQGCDA